MLTEFSNHPQKVIYPYNAFRAFCKEVYDGDTFTVLVDLGFYTYTTVRVRLWGIDTPEMRDSDPVLRQRAVAARDRAAALILNKPCVIMTDRDKQSFDRWIASVTYFNADGTDGNLAATLIDEGHGVPYTK